MLFYLFLLLDSIFLQPVRIFLGFLLRFAWQPPAMAYPSGSTLSLADLKDRAAELCASLDRNKYGQDADSAKFLGMLYCATGKEADWQNVMALVTDDGRLKRCLKDPYPEDARPFSTDMASGFILAVFKRLPLLTQDERDKLAKLWERVIWQGFPFLITSANEGKGKLFERGHIWRPWWVLGSEEALSALVWLRLGYELTGRLKYKIAYRAFFLLQYPALALASADSQVWLGPVVAISAHNTHSRMLNFYVGWQLTGSHVFKWAIKEAAKRHGHYCADIALLAGEWGDRTCAYNLVCDALRKGAEPCPQDKTYYNLLSWPMRETRSGKLMPPSQRGNDYVWERSPIKGEVCDQAYRERRGLDVIFPASFF